MKMIYRKLPKTASLPVTCHRLRAYGISLSPVRSEKTMIALSTAFTRVWLLKNATAFLIPGPRRSVFNPFRHFLREWQWSKRIGRAAGAKKASKGRV